MLDLDKRYFTRGNHLEVEIVYKKKNGTLLGVIDGTVDAIYNYDTGHCIRHGARVDNLSNWDMVTIAKKCSGWVNVYPHPMYNDRNIVSSTVYATKKQAALESSSGLLDIVEVHWQEEQ